MEPAAVSTSVRFNDRSLDAHAGEGPADHELLDLFGAFEDVVDLSETYPLVTSVAVFVA